MTDAPKIDTTAPERIGLIESPFGFALAHRDEADIAIHYVRADLAAAQTAAAWIAGRDASVAAGNASTNMLDGSMTYDEALVIIRASMTPPADGQAALDRLIAEARREERDACADYLLRVPEMVSYRQEHAAAIRYGDYLKHEWMQDRARGSKESRDG